MILRLTPNFLITHLLLAVLMIMAGNTPAMATDSLKPVAREDAFKGLQLDIEKQKSLAANLDKKKKEEERSLDKLKNNIIPVADQIRQTEQTLLKLEKNITNNLIKQSDLQETLKENQKILSDSLIAGLRLKRVPTETLFLQATTPLQTAQTAMILERTAPQIKKRMRFLSQSYQELALLQKQLDIQKQQQQTELASLLVQQSDIETLIKRRQDYIYATQKDIKLAKTRADKLAQDAKSLKDLITKVRAQNELARKEQEKAQRQAQLKRNQLKATSPPVSSENHNWPAAGSVEVRYGVKDVYGAKTQGVKIQTRAGAFVTTPMNGIIQFAGPFKRHGQIIIVEHEGGWHSLISGMETLNVAVGQSVTNGEPIGRMPSQNASERLLLYYELRYKGNPTNPSRKIKGLS